MRTSPAPRLCIILAAAALTGCFEPSPEINFDDDDDAATSGTDPTGNDSADPSGDTNDPSGGSSGNSSTSTTGNDSSNETTDDSSDDSSDDTTGGGDESSSGGSDDESSSGGGGDVEPPTVETMSPADGTTGVLVDTSVELVFSEPMDTASVEAAIDAPDMQPFTLTWDDDGTTATIVPDGGFPYAAGSSPISTDALEFSLTVGTGAMDLAGNELEQGFTASFSSARRITVSLAHDSGYTGAVVSNGVLQTGAGDDPVVGDHSDNLARRGFIGFAISPLPAGIIEIEDAELRADQWLTLGDPMPSLGTTVSIAHIAPEQLPGGAYASTPISSLGIFSDEDGGSADNTKSMNVTDNVQYDYDEGESHTQYRLALPTATNFNSTTDRLRYNDEVLEVTYLVP